MPHPLAWRASYVRRLIRTYPSMIAAIGIAFLLIYLFFDFREGGPGSSLETTKMSDPHRYITFFGAPWFYGMVVADVILAAATAVVATAAIATYIRRRSGRAAACSVGATTLLAFATFGCPGCLVPLAGSLGVTLFANTLPLFGFEFKIAALVILLAALYWQTSPRRAVDLETETGAIALRDPTTIGS